MPQSRTEVDAVAAALPELQGFLQQFWDEARLPPGSGFPFELALEEVFANVVMHGTAEGAPPPRVAVELRRDAGDVTLVIEDSGIAFDPLSLPRPDTDAPLEERAVGGLGVFLVRELMDDVAYTRVGGRNRLTMRKAVAA